MAAAGRADVMRPVQSGLPGIASRPVQQALPEPPAAPVATRPASPPPAAEPRRAAMAAAPGPAAPVPQTPAAASAAPAPPGRPALAVSLAANDMAALRQKVLDRCLQTLAVAGPLPARELAKRLAPLDPRVDKSLINSVLYKEGKDRVRQDSMGGPFRLRSSR